MKFLEFFWRNKKKFLAEVIPERVSGVIAEELPVDCLKTTGNFFEAIAGEIPLGTLRNIPGGIYEKKTWIFKRSSWRNTKGINPRFFFLNFLRNLWRSYWLKIPEAILKVKAGRIFDQKPCWNFRKISWRTSWRNFWCNTTWKNSCRYRWQN